MKPISIELLSPDITTECDDDGMVFKIRQNITPIISDKYMVFKDENEVIYFVNKETGIVDDKWEKY